MPLISICIPAYKNATYLRILLDSIRSQTYKDFEVVVSDDSPDDEVMELCNQYQHCFAINSYKNLVPKGSPANWNNAIAHAIGQWIKIMHDDDWFANENSLQKFADATDRGAEFIFSAYSEYENGLLKNKSCISDAVLLKIKKSPLVLFTKNYIGHPSTTLIKNNRAEWFDENTKWVVDFEFYIRALQKSTFHYISSSEICIGVNSDQITKAVFRKPEVEIPENLYLLNKLGTSVLNNLRVYDYFWRWIRNLGIRNTGELKLHSNNNKIPLEIVHMLGIQKKIPLSFLRHGFISKPLMFCSYLFRKNS